MNDEGVTFAKLEVQMTLEAARRGLELEDALTALRRLDAELAACSGACWDASLVDRWRAAAAVVTDCSEALAAYESPSHGLSRWW